MSRENLTVTRVLKKFASLPLKEPQFSLSASQNPVTLQILNHKI